MTFKVLNQDEKTFYYIEIDVSKYALYDSEFDMPLVYGSKLLIHNYVSTKLPKACTIYYYQLKEVFKLKKTYKGRT